MKQEWKTTYAPLQVDAESVARTVVVFEEIDNLADEDRGFLAALATIIADSKVCERQMRTVSRWLSHVVQRRTGRILCILHMSSHASDLESSRFI